MTDPDSPKRRHPRFALRLPCEILVYGKRHGGTLKDISRCGLFVYTSARPAPGTLLTVVFPAVPGHAEVRVGGIVARIEQTQANLGPSSTDGLGIEVPLGALGRLLGELLRRGRDAEPAAS